MLVHYSSKDTGGNGEKNIQRADASTLPGGVCPVPGGSEVGAQCYLTNYFTTPVNIDSVAPTVASFAFSPAGGIYAVSQNVTASFTCADDRSGVQSCTAKVDSSNTPISSGGAVNTTTAGAHKVTVTAVDNVGNRFSQVYNYTVQPDADVAIFEQETSDKVKPGGTLTYLAWALDLSKTNAAEVTASSCNCQQMAACNLGTYPLPWRL